MSTIRIYALRIIEDPAVYGLLGLPVRDDGWGIVLGLDENKQKVSGLTDDVPFVRMLTEDAPTADDPPLAELPDGIFEWVKGHVL